MSRIFEKLKLFWSKTNRFHRVLFIFALVELKVVPGRKLGFMCNDPALSYPFTGDTISWKWLLGLCLFLPLIVMLLIERKYHPSDKEKPKKLALIWYREYLFGFLMNISLVEFTKQIVGSPRPHFFDTCKPKEALTCMGQEYISNYTCTKAHWLNQSDRSFPSGHTSLSVYTALFITYYLHQRTCSTNTSIKALQVACLALGAFCSISRMTDHRHHWWDVLVGAIVAVGILLYTTRFLCRNFECIASETGETKKKQESYASKSLIGTTEL